MTSHYFFCHSHRVGARLVLIGQAAPLKQWEGKRCTVHFCRPVQHFLTKYCTANLTNCLASLDYITEVPKNHSWENFCCWIKVTWR